MSELLVKLPEDQLPFFLALLERLQFVEIEQINGQKISKEQFLQEFEKSLRDAKLHLSGKVKLPKIEAVLDEL
ncbi:MAG: hypothetical protein IPL27_04415 [Lewinellaceae bacterium]|jgi:hypothetical protein|nr:hypothetical protein [Lewinellaceae bacterium]